MSGRAFENPCSWRTFRRSPGTKPGGRRGTGETSPDCTACQAATEALVRTSSLSWSMPSCQEMPSSKEKQVPDSRNSVEQISPRPERHDTVKRDPAAMIDPYATLTFTPGPINRSGRAPALRPRPAPPRRRGIGRPRIRRPRSAPGNPRCGGWRGCASPSR